MPRGAAAGKTSAHQQAFGGQLRSWLLHVPHGYAEGKPIPLVLAMHGWQRNASIYEGDSGLSPMSDKHDFIVAYPNGMGDNTHPGGPWRSWNVAGTTQSPGPEGPTCANFTQTASMCYESCACSERSQCDWTTCSNDITPSGVGKDDVTGFLPMLYRLLEEELCVDLDRVYATGCSNGGMATYQLGVSFSEHLAAIAPVCGSFQRGYLQFPSVPMPVLDVHGFEDDVVPANKSMATNGWYFTPTDEIFKVWKEANGCNREGSNAISLRSWPTTLDSFKSLSCFSEGDACLAPVVRCGYSGGHGSFAGGGLANGQLVWEFLSRFSKASAKNSSAGDSPKVVFSASSVPGYGLRIASFGAAGPWALAAFSVLLAVAVRPCFKLRRVHSLPLLEPLC